MKLQRKTLENLFVSKVRLKALKFFLLNYSRSIHLRGAVREFDEEINAVRRELIRLEETKLLIAESQGNRKYFKLNLQHPYALHLMSMFHQAYGLGGELIENASKIGDIDFAFFTPAFTRGGYYGDQVVDLVVIGIIDIDVLDEIVKRNEIKIGKDVHYTVLKPSDYAIRKRRNDQFLIELMLQDLVMLIGEHADLVK